MWVSEPSSPTVGRHSTTGWLWEDLLLNAYSKKPHIVFLFQFMLLGTLIRAMWHTTAYGLLCYCLLPWLQNIVLFVICQFCNAEEEKQMKRISNCGKLYQLLTILTSKTTRLSLVVNSRLTWAHFSSFFFFFLFQCDDAKQDDKDMGIGKGPKYL